MPAVPPYLSMITQEVINPTVNANLRLIFIRSSEVASCVFAVSHLEQLSVDDPLLSFVIAFTLSIRTSIADGFIKI